MTDPVCSMTVDPAHAHGPVEFEGRQYYFCSAHCLASFRADPRKYLSGVPVGMMHAPPSPPAKATRYICPMDPEIESDKPGACPKCGMALIPEMPSDEQGPDPEFVDFRRRLIIGTILGAPVIVLAMLDMLPGQPLHHVLSMRANLIIQMVLSTPVVFWSGWPLLHRAI